MRRDLGDFQTPPALVDQVLRSLAAHSKRRLWERALEPTCGAGSFIEGLLGLPEHPREILGIEVQPRYFDALHGLQARANGTRIEVRQASIFDTDLGRLSWAETGPLLVVGNPPWVTNSELGALGSANLPRKANVKGLRGLDAITGGANFDLAEYIWLKLLTELAAGETTIALLCKTSTARNVLEFAHRKSLPVASSWMARLDAQRWFGAAVDACLLCIETAPGCRPLHDTPVFADLASDVQESVVGFRKGRMVANTGWYDQTAFADGESPVVWRQGVKHDASAVMELVASDEGCRNRLGKPVDVEPAWVYPLMKGSDLCREKPPQPRFQVIVTQRFLGDDTRRLTADAPRLWRYLNAHLDVFNSRKSSIYQGRSPFAMFGIGEYSFAPYKVAVSGMAKVPRFHAVSPVAGRPVMLDDTCYFVPCSTAPQAALLAALLKDPICTRLLQALVFTDGKRPVTKKLLQRIDLRAVLRAANRASLAMRTSQELATLQPGLAGERAAQRLILADLDCLLGEIAGDRRGAPGAPPQLQLAFALG